MEAITDIIDPADLVDLDLVTEYEVPNTDYTADLGPIPGTIAEADFWADEPECGCEIDWKCPLCVEMGYRHSRIDGPAFVPAHDPEEPWF